MKPRKQWFRMFLAFALLVPAPPPARATAAHDPAQEPEAVQNPAAPQAAGKKDEKKDEKPAPAKKGLTLKTERTVEFTTDEATWLSLDVSPDGQTIVFELLGDLYTLPIAGGTATRLPVSDTAHKDGHTLAWDAQPKYSPDGKWIAFVSDRDGADNVWIVKADGTEPRNLTKESGRSEFMSPNWTPDNEYVLASRRAFSNRGMTAEIMMYHVRGGSGVAVTRARPMGAPPTAPAHNALGVQASPDGRYFYYSRSFGGHNYDMTGFGQWQVVRRDRRTGDEDTLTAEQGSAIRPLLSPDGTKIVYGTRFETQTGLRLRDLATGEDRWLKYPVQRDDQESRPTRDLLPGYAFLPGGRELVLTNNGKIHRVNVDTGAATPIPFSAKVSQEIGPKLYFPSRVEEGPVRARIVQDATQSPDGKRIAFSAMMDLYVMDLAPGARPQLLLRGNDKRGSQPAWSPDGASLLYVTWGPQGGHIWRVRADGSSPRQLTSQAAYYSNPVWSPDGNRIVALRAARQTKVEAQADFGFYPAQEIVWLPAEGGAVTTILPVRGAGSPHFSRENDRLYLYTQGGLISVRLDGTDRKTHLRVVSPPMPNDLQPPPAFDVRISPDGQWALANVLNQLWVVNVPPVGGDAPTVNVRSPAVPVKKLDDVGADFYEWADDGKTVAWSIGSTFYRQPFSTIEFEPPKPPAPPEKKEETAKEGEKKDAAKPGEKPEEKKEEQKEEKKPEPKKNPNIQEFEIAVERPRAKPQGTIVLRGANVITMKGDEILKDADVVVTDNRIAAVGARGKVSVPAGARVMDVKGMTIIPGMVDTHAHFIEIRRGILDLDAWPFLTNLAYGVTSGLDVQALTTTDLLAYQDMIDAGLLPGPRAYNTGQGVFWTFNFSSADDAKNYLSRYTKHYRTPHIKSYMVGNRKQRQWVIDAAKELKLMPTTEGGLDMKLDLTHALDGMKGNEHNLPIQPLFKDVAELYAQTGIFYTPTLIVTYGGPFGENYFYESTDVHGDAKLNRFTPHNVLDGKTRRRAGWWMKDEYAFKGVAEGAAKIVRAGGKVCIGAHGQIQGLGYHWEMWMLASGGLTPHQVLRAATLHGAEALGLAQDLGSIEPGKLADLVILGKDPLADIHNTNNVKWVMKNGELFNGDTMDQEWPVKKPLPQQWWWNDKPKN